MMPCSATPGAGVTETAEKRLVVLMAGKRVGVVGQGEDGRLWLEYEEQWRIARGATPLSLVLPERVEAVVGGDGGVKWLGNDEMAERLRVGGEDRVERISGRHWRRFAETNGLDPDETVTRVDALAARTPGCFADAARDDAV